jgi:2-dehydropantoate 2-reductase
VRILVVGAGALGTLFAGLLNDHADVCIKTEWEEQATAIRQHGITIQGIDGAVRNARVAVALDASEIHEAPDAVLVCVKVYETAAKLGELAGWIGEAPVVTIQNGLAQLEIIASIVGDDRLCAAPTYQAATKLRPGVIRHSANGETVLWSPGTVPDGARQLSEVMAKAGMPVRIDDDGRRASWEKLVVTAGLNALAAILHTPVGGLSESLAARDVAGSAAEEARHLAGREGQRFSREEIAGAIDGAIDRTAANYSSMLQDLLAGRPTEIEFVNGFVAQRSREHGLTAPVNALLRDLVVALSDTTHLRVRSEPVT